MKKGKILVFILLFLVKFTTSFAQIDTVFWFAVPWVTPDHTWREPYKVHVSGPAAQVRIYQPNPIMALNPTFYYDTTVTIPAANFFDYTFWRDVTNGGPNRGYDSLEARPADAVRPYGLKIKSVTGQLITVVYDVVTRAPTFYNPETFFPERTKWNGN